VTIDVPPQLVGVAAVPLNLTVLVPWLLPKWVPVIVTDAPTAPEVGDRLVIVGEAASRLRGNTRTKSRRKPEVTSLRTEGYI